MSKRILVIEPSPTLRAILVLYFERDGHQVALFEDYEAAVQALPHFQAEPPDLAFVALDSRRPACFRILTLLRQYYGWTKLIVMLAQEESKQLGMQNQLRAVRAIALLKPFSIKEVLALVADAGHTSSDAPSITSVERDGNA
ncbi:MAG: hypothetical protein JO202_11850 [Ktedonobacteraceae bacterium]|nr:hypothetical protein [Ktedonobacteraceae bacterium]